MEKTPKKGRPAKNLIADAPFSAFLARILRERGEANSAIEARAGLSGGAIKNVLRSGNPTLQTVWALERALGLRRGELSAMDSGKVEVAPGGSDVAIPFPAGARPAANLDRRPTRGLVAADDSGGSKAPDTDDFGDEYVFPSGLVLVPVIGDSMLPIVLPGQFVEIDTDREGFERDNGIYVVSVREPDDDDGYPEPIVGTFVKRCELHENLLYLKSANNYSPFSVHVDHCRIWPVLGVWFGDMGKPPENW